MSKAAVCGWFGISRQAYYQSRKREIEKAAQDEIVVELVQGIRQWHPHMGGRKLYHELKHSMQALEIKRGRDKFFELLRERDLLVPPKRNRRRTTFSGSWRRPNLLEDLTVERVNQVWVGDITYIATEQGFRYLALLTDAHSRYIVGYDLSDSLAVEGCLRALNQAIEQTDASMLPGLIHHSDHGIQYMATVYADRLSDAGILASMGEVGNCYDNALAERMNGILKYEYNLNDLFVSDRDAEIAVQQAIYLYNYERPHLSLDYAKPAQIHFGMQQYPSFVSESRAAFLTSNPQGLTLTALGQKCATIG